MAKFNRKGKSRGAAISTASLPDIIFMLLFFFMVTTVMREVDLKVRADKPEATETVKLENKALVDYIYIGPPTDEKFGTEARIQLNDQFADVTEVRSFIETKRSERKEAEQPFITTSLKVDKTTKMGVISDVKQQLRKAYALKMNYSTLQRAEQ